VKAVDYSYSTVFYYSIISNIKANSPWLSENARILVC
jgi:hypothetical protein